MMTLSKAMTFLTCTNNHSLGRYTTPEVGYYCDICSTTQPAESVMYGCDECEYDLCSICNLSELEKKKTPLPSVSKTNTTATATPTSTTSTPTATHATPTPPTTASSPTKFKSPRKWGLVKLKVAAKEDSFQDIASRCDIKSLSIAVKAARSSLKEQTARAKLDAARALQQRNLEHQKKLSSIQASESTALSKETLAARQKIAADKAIQKKKAADARTAANIAHQAKLDAASKVESTDKKLDAELLRKRKKLKADRLQAREKQKAAQKQHALRQREKITKVKAKSESH